MKSIKMLLLMILSISAMAETEVRTLKYSCLESRSYKYNFYEILKDGSRQFSITQVGIGFFHGESEIYHFNNPFIVDFGNVYMVTQNNGDRGYNFFRFENNNPPSEELGSFKVHGVMDVNPEEYNAGIMVRLMGCSKYGE